MMDAMSPATTTQYYPSQHQAQAEQQQQFQNQQPIMAHESVCGGCKEPIESESGGVVVSFGDALWHVKCFRCAKCHERVTADTNLLLLSDGSPVCGSCSYNCNVCKLPILDEAIMTGDESYHAGCFTCRSCGDQIQELVFAKTTNGIYCMKCHNERVARSRRHAEQKRNKSKSKGDAASTTSSHRQKERREQSRPPDMPLSPARPAMPNVTAPSNGYHHPPAPPTPTSSYMSNSSSGPASAYPSSATSASPTPGASVHAAHEAFPFPAKRVSTQSIHRVLESADRQGHERGRVDTLPVTFGDSETEDERRRKSADDGVRPLNHYLNTSPLMSNSSSSSSNQTLQSGHTTSRADKRKSINPATGLFQDGPTSSVRSLPMLSASEGRLSPATDPRASYQTIDGVPASTPKSPGERSMYYSPSPSPVPQSNSSSRSPSPHPPSSNSAPNLAHSGTTPPTPDMSAKPNRHLGQHLDAFPPRMNSLPNGLTEREERRRGRSPSPSPRRATDTLPTPAISSTSSDAGMETDGDVVMVPRGSAEGKRDSAPVPPPKERSSPRQDEDDEAFGLIPPPALPPMRFSVNSTDFSSLLSSVTDEDANRSLKDVRVDSPSLEDGDTTVILSPPPMTSRSNSTNGTARGEPLALDIPDSPSSPSPPTPPPSSAKSTSSNYSVNANGMPRNNTVPMSLHQSAVLGAAKGRERADSSGSSGMVGSPPTSNSLPTISVSQPPGGVTPRPHAVRGDSGSSTSVDFVQRRLREALKDSNERGSTAVKLDREFVEAIVRALDAGKERTMDLKGQIDTMKRTSQQYMNGFSVAQSEYQKEVAARRDLEAEVTRLRVQLSGQAARLTAMSAESRRQEMMEQMSRDLSANLGTLEREMSKLQVARDLALAEVDELNTGDGQQNQRNPHDTQEGSTMTRSLTVRWDGLKSQYRKDLEPLKQQREALAREINELKEARDIFLEETTALNARNEELADLNAQIARQIEVAVSESTAMDSGSITDGNLSSYENGSSGRQQKSGGGIFGGGRMKNPPSNSPSFSSANASITSIDERDEFGRSSASMKHVALPPVEAAAAPNKSKFKWFGVAKEKEKKPKLKAHNFQHFNLLRFTRCDHCSDKMWGPQLRCSGCGVSCHPRCQSAIQTPCQPSNHAAREDSNVLDIAPLPPSMFGRDLVEQARADAKGADIPVPMIVEKCIGAVEFLGMDYEGIYRKNGGSSQSKLITQLFERGDYDAFDLRDSDAFNDICSVTSVLKNYFRALPDPLLTYALHEAFVSAACLKDPREKHTALLTLVAQLPREHYMTLRALMLHLNGVQQRKEENLMNARNLGVVFGPTLMRPSDMSKEFADMAGKALTVEWLVENALEVFDQPAYS